MIQPQDLASAVFLTQALKLADRFLAANRIDITARYLNSVNL